MKPAPIQPTATDTPRSMESGLPLGGIGAGKIEFCADGRFTNITTNNNWDCPIVDEWARYPDMPRIKEGFPGSVAENASRRRSLLSVEGLPGAWLAVHTPADGARLLKTAALPPFVPIESIGFEGRFPVARAVYAGLKSIRLDLEAFGSFVLPDASEKYRDSSLPLALFVFRATNQSEQPVTVTVAASWQNLNGLGGYPMHAINRPIGTPPVFREESFGPGLWFGHDAAPATDARVVGDYSLRAWTDGSDPTITYQAGWHPMQGDEVWDALSADGRLANGQGAGPAGALAIQVVLPKGGQARLVFALSWHMPQLLAAESAWDHLVGYSSAPPEPTSPNRNDYGHIYSRWFADSWAAGEFGLRNWESLRAGVAGWQDALTNSSLPARFVTGLCNDLFPLVTNTWYTREGHYTVNEAPTDMKGCLGTIDQRAAGNAVVAMAFPELDRSEIDLFAADQIGQDDPRRYGFHWDTTTGRYDRRLDRAGAILHDCGWDHLEGGRTGRLGWLSLHWPDLSSVFVLQAYQYAIWNGDRDWIDRIYPRIQAALAFQEQLDMDGDGIAEVWGSGCCTYDTELFPYYGACSFVATLYLAALRAAERLAELCGDKAYADHTRRRFHAAQATVENVLWDEVQGYYLSWVDKNHKVWTGPLVHAERSEDCHISQLAGAWWSDLLGLGDIVDPARRRRALETIGRLNVAGVPGCPANEVRPDGTYSESWLPYLMCYYAAQAIAAGLPGPGWMAVENVYRVRYDVDGSPWDTPLEYSGEGNQEAQWGRWYMSLPSSWYVLLALNGVRLDRLHGEMEIRPSWPSAWGDVVTDLPLFLPGLQARVSCRQTDSEWHVEAQASRLLRGPIEANLVRTRLPAGFDPRQAQVSLGGALASGTATVHADGQISITGPLRLEREGDSFAITIQR